MQIRKCPCCISYIHFDAGVGQSQCWNCRTLTDFSKQRTRGQRLCESISIALSEAFYRAIQFNGRSKWSRLALLTALPVAVIMLLVCNSLDVSIVKDMSHPFSCWVRLSPFG